VVSLVVSWLVVQSMLVALVAFGAAVGLAALGDLLRRPARWGD
jgi:hypothetical protein